MTRLEDEEALVPHLWHLEMRNGLPVATRRGRIDAGGLSARRRSRRSATPLAGPPPPRG